MYLFRRFSRNSGEWFSKVNLRSTAQRGMSLIEIIIVTAVLGSLVAWVMQTMMARKEKTNVGRTEMKIQALSTEIELYKIQNNNKIPTSLDQLDLPPAALQDLWNRDFVYTPEGSSYRINTPLENTPKRHMYYCSDSAKIYKKIKPGYREDMDCKASKAAAEDNNP